MGDQTCWSGAQRLFQLSPLFSLVAWWDSHYLSNWSEMTEGDAIGNSIETISYEQDGPKAIYYEQDGHKRLRLFFFVNRLLLGFLAPKDFSPGFPFDGDEILFEFLLARGLEPFSPTRVFRRCGEPPSSPSSNSVFRLFSSPSTADEQGRPWTSAINRARLEYSS